MGYVRLYDIYVVLKFNFKALHPLPFILNAGFAVIAGTLSVICLYASLKKIVIFRYSVFPNVNHSILRRRFPIY